MKAVSGRKHKKAYFGGDLLTAIKKVRSVL